MTSTLSHPDPGRPGRRPAARDHPLPGGHRRPGRRRLLHGRVRRPPPRRADRDAGRAGRARRGAARGQRADDGRRVPGDGPGRAGQPRRREPVAAAGGGRPGRGGGRGRGRRRHAGAAGRGLAVRARRGGARPVRAPLDGVPGGAVSARWARAPATSSTRRCGGRTCSGPNASTPRSWAGPSPPRTPRRAGTSPGWSAVWGCGAAMDRPTTMLCYTVPDVDGAVALVRAAGGTATDPSDSRYGRHADCVDDQGIPFALNSGGAPAGPGRAGRPEPRRAAGPRPDGGPRVLRHGPRLALHARRAARPLAHGRPGRSGAPLDGPDRRARRAGRGAHVHRARPRRRRRRGARGRWPRRRPDSGHDGTTAEATDDQGAPFRLRQR